MDFFTNILKKWKWYILWIFLSGLIIGFSVAYFILSSKYSKEEIKNIDSVTYFKKAY